MVSLPSSPIAVYRGPFTERHAARLVWRAGFGPTRGQPRRLAALGLDGAVRSLTRPSGPARLSGKAPHDDHGRRVLDTNGASYPARESASQALTSALRHWDDPPLSTGTRRNLLAFSRRAQRGITADWEQVTYRVPRQNALRALIPTTPEWQTS